MTATFRIGAVVAIVALIASCNLDTTPPNELPHFPPAWKLVSIDSQPLPDTLALNLENSPAGTLHVVEDANLEFYFLFDRRSLRWSMALTRLTDGARFVFSFDAQYYQFGADSIAFPTSRVLFPEFFGRKQGDSLTVVSIWEGDPTTPASLVGSHRWRFARDTTVLP